MKSRTLPVLVCLLLVIGCATTKAKPAKLVIWETSDVQRAHDILGPVSVTEEMSESTEDAIQGIAGMISKDGRVSDQIPAETKAALEAKGLKYKDMIFDKLGVKAKEYDADAVIGATYSYVPPFASFSRKSIVTAKGTMIKYK